MMSQFDEDITFVNVYAPNIKVPQYVKQILTDLKGEVDINEIVGDLHQWINHSD